MSKKIDSEALLKQPVAKVMLRMALPWAVGLFFNTMYNIVDTYWAGRYSASGLGAMSLNFPIFMIIIALGGGLGAGTNALIANALGAGRKKRALLYLGQSLSWNLILSFSVILALLPLMRLIFSLNDVSATLSQQAFDYGMVIVLGAPLMALPFTLNAALLASGDSRSYGYTLVAGFFLNLLLDPLFLYGLKLGSWQLIPAWGLRGVALATLCSQLLAIVVLSYRNKKQGMLSLQTLPLMKLRWRYSWQLLQQSLPALLSWNILALGSFLINFFATRSGGDVAISAYGLTLRLEQIALIPALSLNGVLASIVGQNYGAKQLQRVKQSHQTALLFGLVTLFLFYIPIMLLSPWLLPLFLNPPSVAVVSTGVLYLRIQTLSYSSYIVLHLGQSFMQGIKEPRIIFYLSLYRQVIAALPVYYLLSSLWGVTGLWWGIALVNASAALWLQISIHKRWKKFSSH